MDIFNLLLLFSLIGLTAFFVAVEFAIIRVRSTRIDQLIAEGKRGALSAKRVTSNLDEYLSACQLGITITALGLGWIGEPTVEKILSPLFKHIEVSDSLEHVLSFGIAFSLVTFLHVVVGELAPKTIAIQKAERITLLLAKPIIIFYKMLYPFIWVLNGSARLLIRLLGFKPASEHENSHSEDELRMILSESYKSGEINKSELNYMNNIFDFDNKTAKDIMIPRTHMVTLSSEDVLSDILSLYRQEAYTRYPITNEGNRDDIIGVVNIKDLLSKRLEEPNVSITVGTLMKPVIRVLENTSLHDLLRKMQSEQTHLAIIIDEYGGTSGMVTAEDILEVIVGEIRDEFDSEEVPDIQKLDENCYLLNGKTRIDTVNKRLSVHLPVGDADTIGGWILSQELEENNDSITKEGLTFKVKQREGLHIQLIEVIRQPKEEIII